MPSKNKLHLKKQTGSFDFDDDACFEEMRSDLGELYEESVVNGAIPHMFQEDIHGQIKVFDGGYDADNTYGNYVVTWGWSVTFFLEILAKNLTGDGALTFIYMPEGNPPSIYIVTEGNVEEV